jgi:hypothetical protein
MGNHLLFSDDDDHRLSEEMMPDLRQTDWQQEAV